MQRLSCRRLLDIEKCIRPFSPMLADVCYTKPLAAVDKLHFKDEVIAPTDSKALSLPSQSLAKTTIRTRRATFNLRRNRTQRGVTDLPTAAAIDYPLRF
ncbi:MAG: hypothetical protein AAGH41_11775 [Pseudomonadota bacterium]